MKNKLFSIFTALAMVLGILVAPFTTASAYVPTETGDTKVIIHKILMDENKLDVKKVTVNGVTKYIYKKTVDGATKYYKSSNDTEVTDQDFINAFDAAPKVFAGKIGINGEEFKGQQLNICLLYTSPSPRD